MGLSSRRNQGKGGDPQMDPEFLKRLACPVCKVSLQTEGENLTCGKCGRRYPIRDGVPVLLADEAEKPESR
jgi:uncharacterized protein YbaR (Trm112 family)